MLRDVVRHRRRRWAHAPVIHPASHFYHEKKVAWVSISMHACDPVPTVMGLRLAALRAAGAPLQILAAFRPHGNWQRYLLFSKKEVNKILLIIDRYRYYVLLVNY